MKHRARRKRLVTAGVVLAVVAALAVWAFYAGLTLRRYTLEPDKLAEGESIRIVQISDLHSHVYGPGQRDLLKMIEAAQPDIIALTGDIVDDHESEAGAWAFLAAAADIAPCFYVSGNHEFWSGEMDRIKAGIEALGITVLENETATVSAGGSWINICGIDDPEVLEYSRDPVIAAMDSPDALLAPFASLPGGAVNILLAHRPERFGSYQNYDFDLVLSGHAHGGQVRIPLIANGLFAPDQGSFPKYAGGWYAQNGQVMIVSRGLSFNAVVPRIFNPPEVVVVDIAGTRQD